MHKYLQKIATLCIAGLIGFAPFAQAAAPKAQTQVPGYYRIQLGQFEITALYDGNVELDSKMLRNATSADLDRLLASKFVGNPKMQTSINAYLVNTGINLVLVDVGAAKVFGPTMGFLLQNLKAAGYEPAQVDTVLITHMHGDHIGGLNDASGKPVFPKARVFVSQAENDFWLSQKVADSAPVGMQPFFKIARDSAAPYLAGGQWKTFTAGSELVPGIQSVNTKGHTPGNTAYAVESNGQKLLIWGDVVHSLAVQFTRPGVAIEFDADQKQAIAIRRSVMKAMAASKSLVASTHLPFPGIGHVFANGKDSYSWVPIELSPMPVAAK